MGNRRYNLQSGNMEEISAKLLYVTSSADEGDWPSLRHSHYFTEIFYILDGNGRMFIENEIQPVKKDDVIIINPNAEHTEVSVADSPLKYMVLGVSGINFIFPESHNYTVYNYASHRESILTYFRLILSETENQERGYELICQNLLEVLLVQLMRCAKFTFEAAAAQKTRPECARIKKYIDSNFSSDIKLDELAGRAHLNKYYLVHEFTKYYGLSPINYLNEKRIQCSKELLESTDHSIAEIARLAGFSSQSYFAQSFKKSCGVNAAYYRKSTKSSQKNGV